MGLSYLTVSWIGLTTLTPLSALLIGWTLWSIHRKRSKSILLLGIVYSQLTFQFLNFTFSTLTLLKLENLYVSHISLLFNCLVFFKSLTLLSLHLEEFYKIKSPSNYLLNINSSLLKYHLVVLLLLSLMGAYLLRFIDFVPSFGLSDRFLVGLYVTFHSVILLLSLFLLGLKICLRRKSQGIIIGTNSTSSSTNLFGLRRDGAGGSGGRQGIAASGVATVNLIINASLIGCCFWIFWLPTKWPLINVMMWFQVLESLLLPIVYWTAHAHRHGCFDEPHKVSTARYYPKKNGRSHNPFSSAVNSGSLCFNNGEFQYFAGGKNNSESILNNGMPSECNTIDSSFHQARSYTDSFRCASVTTVANDDFEFVSRGYAIPPQLHLQFHQQPHFSQSASQHETIIVNKEALAMRKNDTLTVTASLSMNDLDLLNESHQSAENDPCSGPKSCSKYKKNGHPLKKRFLNKSLCRRVLSLESLHSSVNESSLAYLDTGERVMIFTTDFI